MGFTSGKENKLPTLSEGAQSQTFGQAAYSLTLGAAIEAPVTVATSLTNITDYVGLTDLNLEGDVSGVLPTRWLREAHASGESKSEVVGDVALLFAGAGIGTKGVRALGTAAAASRSKLVQQVGGAILPRVTQLNQKANALRAYDNSLAAMGMRSGTTLSRVDDATRKALRGEYLKTATVNGAKEAVAQELTIAAILNDSDLLFPEDASLANNLMFAGGGVALGSTIERAFASAAARYSYKTSLAASQENVAKFFADNPHAVDTKQVSVIPGMGWTGLNNAGQRTAALRRLGDDIAANGMDAQAQSRLATVRAAQTAAQKSMMGSIDTLSRQKFDLKASTSLSLPGGPDTQQRKLLSTFAEEQPEGTFGIYSLETADNIIKMFNQSVKERREALGKIGELSSSADPKALDEVSNLSRRIQYLDNHGFTVLEPNGVENIMPATRQKPFHEMPNAAKEMQGVKYRKDRGTIAGPLSMKINKFGGVVRKKQIVIAETQSFSEATGLYATLGKVRDQHGGFTDDLVSNLEPNPGAHYAVLDYLVDQGVTSIHGKDIRRLSLQRKYDAYAELAAKKKPEDIYSLSKRLNLRLHDDAGDFSPLGQAFEAMRQLELDDIGKVGLTFDDMVEGLSQVAGKNLTPEQQVEIRKIVEADTDYGMLAAEVGAQPVGIVRNVEVAATDARISATQRAADQREVMLDDLRNGVFGSVIKAIEADPTLLKQAQNIEELGVKHGQGLANVAENFVQTTKLLDRLPLQAIKEIGDRARQTHERVIEAEFRKFGTMIQNLMKVGNEGTQAQISAYNDVIRMVDIEPLVANAGRVRLNMKSPRTIKFFEAAFGEKIKKGDVRFLFHPGKAKQGIYEPLELTEATAQYLAENTRLAHKGLDELNEARRMAGLSPKTKRNGYIMPANFAGKEMQFFRDGQTGEVVGYLSADSPGELARGAEEVLKQNRKLTRISQDEIAMYKHMRDEVFDDRLRDFSDTQFQTGTSKGRAIGARADISGQGLQNQFTALREMWRHNTTRALELYFEPQLARAREIDRAAGKTKAQAEQRSFTAGQEYARLMRGSGELPSKSFMAQVNNTASLYWAQGHDVLAENLRGVRSALPMSRATRKALEAAVQGYKPFDTAVDSARDQYKIGNTTQLRQLSSVTHGLNKAFGYLTLNFGEVGHSILTIGSLAVTTPGVISAIRRMPGESPSQFHARVGGISDYMDDDAVVPSIFKVMTDASEMMLTGEGKKVRQAAAAKGFLDAHYIEQLNNDVFIKPKSVGDMARKVAKYTDVINTPINAVRKLAGKKGDFNLSGTSEQFAREWAFMSGYSVAKRAGGDLNEAQRMTMAHYIANQIIADYTPSVRPEFHRGAVGTSLGLFQTFATGFMQRMYGMIENKQLRAALTQATAQSVVFGAQGVPGWELVNEYFYNTADDGVDFDGAPTLVDRLYRDLGKSTADVLLTGTLANMPKLMGANDGVGIYTRGDVNPRIPANPFNITEAPAIKLMGDTMGGIARLARNVKQDGGISAQELGEVLSAYAPSRSVRSLSELALGQSYNRAGDLMSQNTRTFEGYLARAIGSRPLRETQIRAGLWANRTDQMKQRVRRGGFSSSLTSAIRESGGKLSPELEQYYMELNLATGGNADYWDRTYQYYQKKAMITRATRDAKSQNANPAISYRAERTIGFMSREQREADVEAQEAIMK